jgi:hypothetical protein
LRRQTAGFQRKKDRYGLELFWILPSVFEHQNEHTKQLCLF